MTLLSLHPAFQTLVALDTENGQASVLAGLGQAEEDCPQHALGCSTDGQQHLGKGQDIKRYTAQQDYDSRSVRQRLQPHSDIVKDVIEGILGCFELYIRSHSAIRPQQSCQFVKAVDEIVCPSLFKFRSCPVPIRHAARPCSFRASNVSLTLGNVWGIIVCRFSWKILL